MLDQFYKMPLVQKLLILAVLLIIAGVAFWQFYYAPLKEDLNKVKKQHATLSAKLSEVKKRKKTYDEDLQRREDLKIASVKQRQVLPAETEMASFLNNINTVADLTGLEIVSVKPRDESPEKYYARIPVALNLRGSYLQLAKFFYQIGRLDRVINVENIVFSDPVVNDGGVTMKASVLATTFRALGAQ